MPPLSLILVALAAIVAMSAVPVLVKSTAANEVTIGIARLVIAAGVVSILVAVSPARLRAIRAHQWRQLAVIGAVFAVHWLTYFASIKMATAVIAATAIATYGVQYLLLAWWFNREPVRGAEWLAMLACLGGCAVMVPSLSLSDSVTAGIVVGLVSGFLYACLPLLHQRAAALSNLQRTWGQFSFALLCFLPLWPLADWSLSNTDYLQLLTLGLLCTVVAHGLWVKASTELPPVFTGIIYYVYIPLAMISSSVFLDEAITARKLLGAGMIIGASTLVTLYRWQRSRA
ncbi:DMT family transporter [Litorivivens sp.]|uniref:DMT family transporter n=1 Tax=Litorivivens sp. TaxID=2020868 RepID=UPI003566EA5E